MPRIEFVQGSLTQGSELVLVNASNTNAELGSGVSRAIRQACGPKFQGEVLEALRKKFGGPMAPGDVLVTHAGSHPKAKYVAHVAVMDYRNGIGLHSYPTLETIRLGCEHLWAALETVAGNEPLSVAMVALGAGTGDLGVADPTRIAAQTLKAHCAAVPLSRIERIRFYGYLEHELAPMAQALVSEYPDLKERLPAGVKSEQSS